MRLLQMKSIFAAVVGCNFLWHVASAGATDVRQASAKEVARTKDELAAYLGSLHHVRVTYRQSREGTHWSEEVEGTYQASDGAHWCAGEGRVTFRPGHRRYAVAIDGSMTETVLEEELVERKSFEWLWADGRRWRIERSSGHVTMLEVKSVPTPDLLGPSRDIREIFGIVAYPGRKGLSSMADLIADLQTATVADGVMTFELKDVLNNGNKTEYRVGILTDGSGAVASQTYSFPGLGSTSMLETVAFGDTQGMRHPLRVKLTADRSNPEHDMSAATQVTSFSLSELDLFPDLTALSSDRSVTFRDLDANTIRRSDTDAAEFTREMAGQAIQAREIVDGVLAGPAEQTADAKPQPPSISWTAGLLAIVALGALTVAGIAFHRSRR